MLDISLTLYCITNTFIEFRVDKALQSIAFREAFREPFAVLPGGAGNVGGHPGVKSSIGSVGRDVEPTA